MDDLIRRQDIYDLIDNWDEEMISRRAFRCDVEDLPSAQPDWKKGEWQYLIDDFKGIETVRCSCCRKEANIPIYALAGTPKVVFNNFCPNCGADMRKPKLQYGDADTLQGGLMSAT